MKPTSSRADVAAFRAALARYAGYRFEADKVPFLADLLASRMRSTGSRSVEEYLRHVASGHEEVAELARSLSVSETYFLRNSEQFRAVEAILRERSARGIRHVRILSAGCSTGEEPYSLAIIVRETLRDLSDWTISIVGVDLNPDSIERARAASYSKWSLRETPGAIDREYFRETGKRYQLDDTVRGMVRFELQNLLRPPADFWKRETFDLVFCRNVLMYLTPEAASEIVSHFAHGLVQGGHLFLGHAENLRGLSQDFHLRHSHDTFYYERKSAAALAKSDVRPGPTERTRPALDVALSSDTSWFDTIARASSRIEDLSRASRRNEMPRRDPVSPSSAPPADRDGLAPAMDLMKQERFQEALGALANRPVSDSTEPDALLLHAMLLVSTADLSGARAACARLLALDDLNAGAHYVMAICCEHVGETAGAIEHSQTAAYLDANFAMPHLQLGRLARRAGDRGTARRELGLALGLLPLEGAGRILLFGGGFRRDALIQLCRGELEACGEGP